MLARLGRLLASVACCAALAACTSDATAESPPPRSSSDPPTTAVSTTGEPTSTTKPPPPTMPALARQHSTAGAKAFVGYYAASLNYSWDAKSSSLLRSLAAPNCSACRAVATEIDRANAVGAQKIGGNWDPLSFYVPPTEPADEPIVSVSVQVSKGSYRASASSPRRHIAAGINHFDFVLAWSQHRWLITELRST